jgi:PAS domain S-box-containing protein
MLCGDKSVQNIPYRLVFIGIILGILSWIVESFMHSHIFYYEHSGSISHLLFPLDAHELWMRLIILTLFISFAFYAQHIVGALRKAEQKVQEVNMELSQIFDTAADGMRVIDLDFNTLRANRTFLDMAGIDDKEIEGRKCYDLFSGDTCHTASCPLKRIRNGEERIEYDAIKVREDGVEIPCIVTATPFRNRRGELVGIVEDFKDISDRKRTEGELQRSHEQLRLAASHLEMAREEERRVMAREIHDELGQALTGLKMDVHWLSGRLAEMKDGIPEKIREMDRQLDQTVHTVRRLSAELRPCLLDDLGLSAALEWYADTVRDRLGIPVDIISIPEDIAVNEECSTNVYRIFQEALTNVARHSGASQVEILLIRKQGRITLTVRDNGKGMDLEKLNGSSTLGLIGMQERAALLKGSLKIESAPGKGTTVFLSIPCGRRGSGEAC